MINITVSSYSEAYEKANKLVGVLNEDNLDGNYSVKDPGIYPIPGNGTPEDKVIVREEKGERVEDVITIHYLEPDDFFREKKKRIEKEREKERRDIIQMLEKF